MKILMINVVCGVRSTGRICSDIACALEASGHEVKIAYGRECVPDQYQKYAVRIGSNFDIKLHGAKARLFDGCGFGCKKATEKFISWVKDYDPDVIHLHNLHGYYINVEVLFDYLKSCGKRIIWTLHDCWAFTGHSAYCDVVDCIRWETGCYKCPIIHEYPCSYADYSKNNWLKKKNIFEGVPNLTIVTPSNWLAKLVARSFLSNYPVSVINNGIDTSIFSPNTSSFRKKHNIGERIMVLGVATAWDNKKGLADFVNLSSLLDERYQIVLVGLSKKQMKSLPEGILAIEKTNSVGELADIYNAADVFLNLSYCENYPTVNLEAIACSTPVITYATGGSPEIISQFGGSIVNKGDLKAVVELLHKHNFERKDLSISCRQTIDKSSMVQHYLQEIERLRV